MTLLDWQLTQDSVLVWSDTLCLSSDTLLPRSFVTKVFPVPHIRGVIAGTGHASIITQFYLRVADSATVLDVAKLAQFAPHILRDIWSNEEHMRPTRATSTIYTFGFSTFDECFIGIAYRSGDNFEPEMLQYGFYAKPPLSDIEPPQNIDDLMRIALNQQSKDRFEPRDNRVGIGGELWQYALGIGIDHNFELNIKMLMQMPHFNEDLASITSQLKIAESK